ncbi:MAG TPA: 50S ribosomal protein L2, partial [Dehalococcoidales bacterium]
MALVKFKPTSPGRRNQSGYTFDEITKTEPEKALTSPHKMAAGRNFRGVVTSRRQGGGVKQALRTIDFKREKVGVPGKITAIEYDPNRTSRIALVFYADGEKRYILAPLELKVGDVVNSGESAEVRPGNHLPLKNIPSGTPIHNIEMQKGKGGQLVRSAGGAARLMVKEGDYALVRLPSSELRRIKVDCSATIGQIGNIEHSNISLGKAGRRRLMGWRP